MKEEIGNEEKVAETKEKKRKKSDENALITRESLGAVGSLFSALAFFILVTRSLIFGEIGVAVDSFLLGVFGYAAYALVPVLFIASVVAFIGKSFPKKKRVFYAALVAAYFVLLVVHGAVTSSWEKEGYVYACFSAAAGGVETCTPAGWLGGLIVGGLFSVLGKVLTYLAFVIACLVSLMLCVKFATGKSIVSSIVAQIKGKDKPAKTQSAVGAQSEAPRFDEADITRNQNAANVPYYGYDAYPEERAQRDRAFDPSAGGNAAVQSDGYFSQNRNTATPFDGQNAFDRQNAFDAGQGAQYEKYNEYGFPSDNIRQRPGVTLSKSADRGNPQTGAFSPFGESSAFRGDAVGGENSLSPQDKPLNGRDLIYGVDPIESFRNNLIFDPDSKFNKRRSAANEPQYRQSAPAGNGGFSSYTQAYSDAINGTAPSARVTSERTYSQEAAPAQRDQAFTRDNRAFARETSDFAPSDRTAFTVDTDRTPLSEDSDRTFGAERNDEISTDRAERGFFGRDSARGSDDVFSVRNEFSREREDLDFTRENDDFLSHRGEERGVDRDFGGTPFASGDERSDRAFFRDDEPKDDMKIFDDEAYSVDDDTLQEDDSLFDTRSSREQISRRSDREDSDGFPSIERGRDSFSAPSRVEKPVREPLEEKKVEPPKPKIMRPYQSAPLNYFDCTDTIPDANSSEIDANKQTILDTLEAFKVPDATIASVTCGPTVTRYNVAVPRYISPKKVVALDQSIAMNLHAANGVNIAPNFEDGTISVEVPNKHRQTVTLGSMLIADEYINAKPNSLIFAMGKNVGNKKMYGDIRKMTHILVAGTSGSGKTAFLHSLIISLIMKYSPADLRLILIDPKQTEFVVYEGLPHLVINEVLSDTNKVIQSLNWAIAEMERRFELFSKKSRAGTYVINIDEYNANLAEGEEKLPKIVIIADEVAAMMQDAKKDMEDRIQNLTQKSRATGIHVILATQRPSTDVITGVIKSNLKTRIALSVASEIDSRVILDESGAQNLLGQGDLLYSTEGTKTPIRMQAPFISSEKAQEVIRFVKESNDCCFDEEAAAFIDKPKGQSGGFDGADDEEAVEYVYVDALRYVILSGSASISLVQRKCSVGYNKAGKIIEWMEDQGYISAFDGAKARKVLITPEQFEEKFGPL